MVKNDGMLATKKEALLMNGWNDVYFHMNVKTDNPAGRLYAILLTAKSVEPTKPVKEVWRVSLKSTSVTEMELLKRIIRLRELVAEVPKLVRSIEGINVELYLQHYSGIDAATSMDNLSLPWQDLVENLSDLAMMNLAHCSEILSERYGELVISRDDLWTLGHDLEVLIKTVKESRIDSKLKIIVIDQLEIIKVALAEYIIRGTKGMVESLSSSYGIFMANYELFKKEEDKEEIKSTWDFILKAGKIVVRTVEIAKLGYDLGVIFGFIDPTLMPLMHWQPHKPQLPNVPPKMLDNT